MITIPQRLLSRKHEIAAAFFDLLDQHIEDIVTGRINYVFKIKDFAEQISIDAGHFSNVIKLITKRSPTDFIEERLMAEAETMLNDNTMSIDDIAHKLTFRDPKTFEKVFISVTGKTPGQHRLEALKYISI